MDATFAQSLAAGIDPTSIGALKSRPNDPAVRRAVANQFGAMLMENLMRNADGSPLVTVDGAGGDTVGALFTNVMSQVAASSNQLGFADLLLRSMPPSAGAASSPAASGTALPSRSTAAPAAAAVGAGLPLQPYWQGRHVVVAPGTPFATAPVATPPHASLAAPQAPSAVPPASAPPTSGPSPYDRPPGPAALLPPSGEGTAARRQQFAATVAPLLQSAAQSLGVSPNVLLAQAALESGWGRSMPGNNLFGVKTGAGWSGDTVAAYTHEVSGAGATGQTTSFRAYPSMAAAVADYVRLIAHDPRYRAALGAGDDPLAYGRALMAGGYATDPAYADKLAAVAASPTLTAAIAGANGVSVAAASTGGGAA